MVLKTCPSVPRRMEYRAADMKRRACITTCYNAKDGEHMQQGSPFTQSSNVSKIKWCFLGMQNRWRNDRHPGRK